MWLYTGLSGIMQLDMCSLYKYRYWLRERFFVQRKLTKDYFCPSGVEVKNKQIYYQRSWVRFYGSITRTYCHLRTSCPANFFLKIFFSPPSPPPFCTSTHTKSEFTYLQHNSCYTPLYMLIFSDHLMN